MDINEEYKKQMDKASEIVLFYTIRSFGEFRSRLNRNVADIKDIESIYNLQAYAVSQLTRFGIKPFEDDGKTPSKEYWEWYYKWDKFEKALSDEEYKKLEDRINREEDTSDVRCE